MDLLVTIDANLTLDQTRERCEVTQNRGFQLDSLQFGTVVENGQVFPVNKAEFNLKLSGRLKHLLFLDIAANDPDALRKKKETEGWTFICDSQIFVQNHVTKVLVLGRKELA